MMRHIFYIIPLAMFMLFSCSGGKEEPSDVSDPGIQGPDNVVTRHVEGLIEDKSKAQEAADDYNQRIREQEKQMEQLKW